jgi:MFS family permease
MLGTQVISTPLLGMLGDRRGHKGTLQLGIVCTGLAMLLAVLAPAPYGFYATFALLGISTGIQFTMTLNMVVEFADEASRVTYIGLHGTLLAPATMLAPLLGGWLADAAGFGALFFASAACCALAWAVMTFAVRDPRHRQVAR